MARARHEMLIAVLLGYFVPERGKICLVSKLSVCGQPDLLFLGSGEAVLMTGRTRWAEGARQRALQSKHNHNTGPSDLHH